MASATGTQRRAIGRGLAESATRDRERVKSPLILHHNLSQHRASLLLQQIQTLLPTGVSLVAAPIPDGAALAASEAHVERLIAEKAELMQQMQRLEAALSAQIEALTPPASTDGDEKWVTITEAKKRLGKCYATVWRAVTDGRMTARNIGGGTKRSGWLVLASTFREKVPG